MKDKALLFINGEPPKSFPILDDYHLIACTDGAFYYLEALNFPLDKLNFISGDFDSFLGENIDSNKLIHTPNQEKTDFQKALEILLERGISSVDVYGASGGEQDHFLGNLTVANRFKDQLEIKFFDEHSTYYFIPNYFELENGKGRMISLYPFPKVENLKTNGLKWELHNINADMSTDMLTRNEAVENKVSIEYEKGNLLIFIAHSK